MHVVDLRNHLIDTYCVSALECLMCKTEPGLSCL